MMIKIRDCGRPTLDRFARDQDASAHIGPEAGAECRPHTAFDADTRADAGTPFMKVCSLFCLLGRGSRTHARHLTECVQKAGL